MRNAWLNTTLVCLVLGGTLWNCRPTVAAPGDVLATFHNPNPWPDDAFGYSLAVSGDCLAVGDPRSDLGADQAGAAYLFDARTGAYIQTLQHPAPAFHDFLGFSLAATDAGFYAGAIYRGAGYLFDAQSGGVLWSASAGYSAAALQDDIAVGTLGYSYLLDGQTGATKTEFPAAGYSIAASDGRVLTGDSSGQACLFDAATATLLRTFTDPSAGATVGFGVSVAFLQSKVVVGATTDDGRGGLAGAVYLFDRDSGALLRTLTSPSASGGDCFGLRVAAVGDDILVGAPRDDTLGTDAGSAFLFDGTTGALLLTYDSPDPTTGDGFGSSLAAYGLDVAIGYGNRERQEVYLFEGVPEPATLSLLALGGLVVLRRRSRRLRTVGVLGLVFVAIGLTAGVSPAAEPMFGGREDYPIGAPLLTVASEDFNIDGLPDLAIPNYYNHTLTMLYGQPGGGFGSRMDFAAGTYPAGPVVRDFNQDGLPDIALTQDYGACVRILYNQNGTGFGGARDFAVGANPYGFDTADFNRDGRPDVATANWGSPFSTVLYGQPDGGLGGRQDYDLGAKKLALVAADFNGDSLPDFAVTFEDEGAVRVLYNQGTDFGGQETYAVGTNPRHLAAGDFNADGRADLAIANLNDGDVTVLLAEASGGFGDRYDLPVGAGPDWVVTADFDRDGRLDLGVMNAWDNDVSVFLGDGNGGFGSREGFAVGGHPMGAVAWDLDGDGWLDLAIANWDGQSVTVLYNALPEPATIALVALGGLVLLRRRRASA